MMNLIENDDLQFWIENGLLYSEFKKPIVVTFEKAKELIALRHKISNNKKQYWCYSLTNVKFFTKEGRNYAESHGQEFLHAVAVIANSHLTLFIINVFNKWHNVKIPLRVFTKKGEAIAWLKELKQQTSN